LDASATVAKANKRKLRLYTLVPISGNVEEQLAHDQPIVVWPVTGGEIQPIPLTAAIEPAGRKFEIHERPLGGQRGSGEHPDWAPPSPHAFKPGCDIQSAPCNATALSSPRWSVCLKPSAASPRQPSSVSKFCSSQGAATNELVAPTGISQ
jgi:hypothetical protein